MTKLSNDKKEGKMQCFRTAVTVLIFTCFCAGMLFAAENLPDLTISWVTPEPAPKDGVELKSIKINVKNQGNADSGESTVQLNCMVAQCASGSDCEKLSQKITGDIFLPALRKGESIILEWVPLHSVIWVEGKYTLVVEVDKYNVVKESNEENNISKTMIFATSLSARSANEAK